MTKALLTRYWFQFDKSARLPPGVLMGCGISAYDKNDAFDILKRKVFKNIPYVQPIDVVSDIDVSTLDQNHILPNMYSPSERGVWFPIGYL